MMFGKCFKIAAVSALVGVHGVRVESGAARAPASKSSSMPEFQPNMWVQISSQKRFRMTRPFGCKSTHAGKIGKIIEEVDMLWKIQEYDVVLQSWKIQEYDVVSGALMKDVYFHKSKSSDDLIRVEDQAEKQKTISEILKSGTWNWTLSFSPAHLRKWLMDEKSLHDLKRMLADLQEINAENDAKKNAFKRMLANLQDESSDLAPMLAEFE